MVVKKIVFFAVFAGIALAAGADAFPPPAIVHLPDRVLVGDETWTVPKFDADVRFERLFDFTNSFAKARAVLADEKADGVFIDWTGRPPVVAAGRGERDAFMATWFLRYVKEHADAAAKKRGRPFKVGASVPGRVCDALAQGLDVAAWAREGLVDLLELVPNSTSSLSPEFIVEVGLYRRLAPKAVLAARVSGAREAAIFRNRGADTVALAGGTAAEALEVARAARAIRRAEVKDLPLAICLRAPATNEVDRLCALMKDRFGPDGIRTVVLIVRYDYRFASHPECAAPDGLTLADVRKICAAAREAGITLIPKMNLFGHQGEKGGAVPYGLIKAYPDMDESRGRTGLVNGYCRSICPNHPDARRIVCDLMDEMTDAFGAKAIHIGCDEVFEIGFCERCRGIPNAKLFADWVNGLARHNAARGVRTLIWADRLLDSAATGYGEWEASDNGTADALGLLDKDIVLCDWHYEWNERYPSAAIFAKAGFRFWFGPWRYLDNARRYVDETVRTEDGHALGLMLTTWKPFTDVADAFDGKYRDGCDAPHASLAETLWNLVRVYDFYCR